MTRTEKIKAMRKIVRNLGRKNYYKGRMCQTLTVPIVIVCEDDTCTEVEIGYDGRLCIMGWDGTEGLGDYAEKFKDEEIDKLYTAMVGMAN